MKKLSLFACSLVVGLAMSLSSCVKDGSREGNGKVSVRLTDAPANYDAVYVDIQSLEFSVDGTTWQTFEVSKGVYNLLDFRNGLDTLIVNNQILPAGHITQMRMVLGANNSVVIDGVNYPLKTPSAQQSGLKFKVNATVLADASYTIWVDFDANASVVSRGNGEYNLKPVIRAYTQEVDGKIKGTVLPAAALANIEAINGTDTIRSSANIDGSFVIGGLADGMYSVHIMPTVSLGVSDTTIQGVAVKFGTITNLNTITLK